jgi:hypothetical protein
MPTEENIRLTDGKIVLGGPAREITAMRVKAGRMRAVIEVRSHLGTSEAFVTGEEARALGKWLTTRVKDADREDRWQRFRQLLRFGRGPVSG